MTTKRWIAVGIAVAVILGSLGLIKIFPFWVTLACLVTFVGGFIGGYLFKKPEIVETIKEVIKEVPTETKVKKASSKK